MSRRAKPSGLLWQDPFAPREAAASRLVRFGAVAGLHVALLAAVASMAVSPQLREAASELVVRVIETPPPRPEVAPPKPLPVRQEVVRPVPPPPVMTAAADVPATSAFAVAPQPPAPPSLPPVQAAAPTAPAVTAARFDADYLHNPKPVYPVLSRRQAEEGKVQLRVRVAADGAALEVEVKQSSGFQRLDSAARDAVQKWRFVPAKRGDEAIESWVSVPIVFKLES